MAVPIDVNEFTRSGTPQDGGSFGSTTVIDASSPDTLTLPSGRFATDATFQKQGDDLLLKSPDGETVIVRDYYLADPAPDLMTPEGGRLTPALVESFTPPEAAGQFAQMGASGAVPIGQAESTVGTVFVARATGVREELNAGDPIYQGDVVETADGGAVDLMFVDKTTFALGGDARLAIDELVYDPNTQEGTSSFSILKGMFVFSSGEIAKANPLDMTVQTTVATIGIRGTKVAGEVLPAGEESKFTILEGEIVVVTDAGYTVLSDPNETSTVTSFDAAPSDATLFSASEIGSFYSEVKSISGGFYGTSSSGNRGTNDKTDTEPQNEQGVTGTETGDQSLNTETDSEEAELAQLAETLSDLAPAAGGDTEEVNERGEISDSDIESRDVDLGKGFDNDTGFTASTVVTPSPTTAPQTAAGSKSDGPAAVTPGAAVATPIDSAPVIAKLTAQTVQATPTSIAHTLETQSTTNGVNMSDLHLPGDHSTSVTFMVESAGYRSSVGYYKISGDGELTDPQMIWANTSADGSGGDLLPGASTFTLDVEAGDQLGFFLVANGDRRNKYDNWGDGEFEFRDGGDPATLESINPSLFFIGTDGEEHKVKGNIFHTAEADGAIQLNTDGLSHTVSDIDAETGGLVIGFEDLKNLGDRDFNDVVIRIDFEPIAGQTLTPAAIAPDIALSDADSATLTSATLEIVSGFEDGDFLQVGDLEEYGIDISEQGFDETAGVYRLTLSGEASLDIYETVLSGIGLASLSNSVEPGLREIAISVTDDDGIESDIATASVTVEAATTITDNLELDLPNLDRGDEIIIRGGEGDDRLVLDDNRFDLVDGGAGTDTLVVDSDLDLGEVADNALRNIESFDLGGGGATALTLGLDDVLAATSGINALTESENTLVVRRDENDTVNIVGDTWEVSSETLDTDGDQEQESYTVYRDAESGATVYVESNAALA